jgi:hypothetical protein
MSSPSPPEQRVVAVASVHGHRLVGEHAAALVDANLVVTASCLHVDRRESSAVEAEVGGSSAKKLA